MVIKQIYSGLLCCSLRMTVTAAETELGATPILRFQCATDSGNLSESPEWQTIAEYDELANSLTADAKLWNRPCFGAKPYDEPTKEILRMLLLIVKGAKELENISHCITLNEAAHMANLLKYAGQWDALANLGPAILSGFNRMDFNVTIDMDAKKRHQAIGLPRPLITVCEQDYPESSGKLIDLFQKSLANDDPVDGNDLVRFSEILHCYSRLEAYIPSSMRTSGCNLTQYVAHLCNIHAEKGLSFYRMGEYLIRQMILNDPEACCVYWRSSSCYQGTEARYLLAIPVNLAKEYEDYVLKMGADEYFPTDFIKEKAYLARRQQVVFTPEEDAAFKARAEHIAIELNREVDGWKFAVPASYQELIDMGQKFHNCLPSCGKAFIGKLMDIVFVTPVGEKQPLYALEVTNNGRIVQAVEDHDLPISDETALKIVDKYELITRKVRALTA